MNRIELDLITSSSDRFTNYGVIAMAAHQKKYLPIRASKIVTNSQLFAGSVALR